MVEIAFQLLTMAASAFLAATVLPFPSEATFAGLLHLGTTPPLALFVVASLANTAGSTVNWFVGRLIADGGIDRLPARLKPEPATVARAEALFRRHGWLALLFSWLPGIGDLATLAAGLLRYPLTRFLPLVLIGKGARYAAIWAGWIAAVG